MRSKVFFAFVLSLIASCLSLHAQTVSPEAARAKAMDFFSTGAKNLPARKGAMRKAPAVSNVELAYTSEKDGKTCFYVYNNGTDGGFVIVGGDEVAQEILAYSDHGHFNYDKAPDNFKDMLSLYTEQISLAKPVAKSQQAKSPAKVAAATTVQKEDIPDLIETTWDQWDPYNRAIPKLVNSNTGEEYNPPTGCVATAVAQIMKYWNYPEHGTGSISRTIDYSQENPYNLGFGGSAPEFGAVTHNIDYQNSYYDWGNMLNNYSGEETEEQINAVSTLMYHVGVACSGIYGIGETTGAYPEEGLKKYFGYSPKAKEISRDEFDDQTWEEIIYTELKVNRPVLYFGVGEGFVGHEYIIHGYSSENDMYSINWGWGGMFDCYCKLTPVEGSTLLGYENHQTAVVRLQPATMESKEEPDFGDTFWLDGLKYRILSSYYNTVEITRPESFESNYSGVNCLPSSVSYKGVDYEVVGIAEFAFSSYRYNQEGNYNYQEDLHIDSLELGDNFRYLGNSAFRGSTTKKIDISNCVTMIGAYCFSECTSLTDIRMPQKIQVLPDYMFSTCWNLCNIEIPEGVTRVGEGCFEGCGILDNLVLPSTIKSIGNGCFENCVHLFSLTCLSEDLPILDLTGASRAMFSDNSRVGTLYVPHESLAMFAASPEWAHWRHISPLEQKHNSETIEINGLIYFLYSDSALVFGHNGLSGQSINIPEFIHHDGKQYCVKIIGEGAFSGDVFQDVVLSDSIEELFTYAFHSSNIEKLTLPKNMKSIAGSALYANVPIVTCYCENVPILIGNPWIHDNISILVPRRLLTQYKEAEGWKQFPTILAIEDTDPNYGRIIEEDGIQYKIENGYASVLKSYNTVVTIKESICYNGITYAVTHVCSEAFATASIREVYVPHSITTMGHVVFITASNLEKVTFERGLKSIGVRTFVGCEGLKEVLLPEGLEEIGEETFASCNSLKKVVFPSTLKAMSFDQFVNCNSLDTIVILSENVLADSRDKQEDIAEDEWLLETPLPDNLILFVPEQTLASYKTDKYWKQAKEIKPIIPLASLAIDKTQIEMTVYNKENLVVQAMPSDASLQYVKWSSSNPAIASVDQNGVVTARKSGTVTITATSMYYPDVTATCTVTVKAGTVGTLVDAIDGLPSGRTTLKDVDDAVDSILER